jgi:hypothetical protein
VLTGALKACTHSFNDQGSLELREDTGHLEERTAGRSGRVEGLLVEVEANASRLQFRQERHEALQTSPESIDAPGRDHVELAPRSSLAHPIERWAPCAALGTTHALINELLEYPPASPASDLVERLELPGDGLTIRRYPGVERYALPCHGRLLY